MIITRITILKGVQRQPETTDNATILSMEELRNRLLRFNVFSLLFRYSEARLLTYQVNVLSKPLRTVLILRCLSREACFIQDEWGNIVKIHFKILMRWFLKALRDWIDKRQLLRCAVREIQELSTKGTSRSKTKDQPNLLTLPLYLRTDLVFGLRSGGSVGHIAGVLNHLDCFCGQPIFLTSDKIPAVREDIETKIIIPDGRFWDFKELPGIYFNQHFVWEAEKHLKGRKVSFVYQRYSLNNYSGLRLAKRFGVPFILEYNGSETWIQRHWGKPLKYEKLSERIELLNLMAADMVVAVSQPMRDELVGRGVEGEKILVNPNGVDPDRYSPDVDGSEIRNQYHLNGHTVIGFIGTFGKWHGAEVLSEAFGQLLNKYPEYQRQVRLFMIGDGITVPLVKENIKKFALNENCILTGLVPQEEGPKYLATCDILVAPHKPNPDGTPFFGSPTKLFEYMAMGKGIVASDLDQIGEVLKHDGTAWLVKPGNTESLIEGLKVLIDDRQKREKLGKEARREVIEKYTWREHTRRIIEKLKEQCETKFS
jgi:glycosyltransferase involved in cell wall biosynthesis